MEDLILYNSTWIGLNLSSWDDGGCLISSLVIEYRLAKKDSQWTLLTNNAKVDQEVFPIYDLRPGTRYSLKLTAHNSAGSSTKTYTFTTLLANGSGIIPMLAQEAESSVNGWVFLCASLAICCLLVAGAGYLSHRIVRHKKMDSTNQLQNPSTDAQLYTQMKLFHQSEEMPGTCLVHQEVPGYCTPFAREDHHANFRPGSACGVYADPTFMTGQYSEWVGVGVPHNNKNNPPPVPLPHPHPCLPQHDPYAAPYGYYSQEQLQW